MEYGRFIKDSNFLEAMKEGGRLSGLYAYLTSPDNLEDGLEKYNLTIRDNMLTLYDTGRKLEIRRRLRDYLFSFDLNIADALLKKDEEGLDKIIQKLAEENLHLVANPGSKETDVFISYSYWKKERKAYFQLDKETKGKEKKNLKNRKLGVVIPHEEMEGYDFKTLLSTLHPIFKSYIREEELYRQRCISSLNDFARDLVVLDVEYEPSLKGLGRENAQRLKEECCTCGSSKGFGKTDLVCLKKEGAFFLPLFVELKVNVSAAVGKKAGILNHLEDFQNYKTLYQNSKRERASFKHYVLQTVRHKLEHGFLKIGNKKAQRVEIEDILSHIKYDDLDFKIVCSLSGLKNETETELRKQMRMAFRSSKEVFESEILVLEDVFYLENLDWVEKKGVPVNLFL